MHSLKHITFRARTQKKHRIITLKNIILNQSQHQASTIFVSTGIFINVYIDY